MQRNSMSKKAQNSKEDSDNNLKSPVYTRSQSQTGSAGGERDSTHS